MLRMKCLVLLILIVFISCKEPIQKYTLEVDETIDVAISQYRYIELEQLYIEYKLNVEEFDIERHYPHIEEYVVSLGKGSDPFMIFEDPSLDFLNIELSTLIDF